MHPWSGLAQHYDMKIETAIQTCIRSMKRFSSTDEVIEAMHVIVQLRASQWPQVSVATGVSENTLPGLVSQCECSIEVIEWLGHERRAINQATLNEVMNENFAKGQDTRFAHTKAWRLYWGAWFLDSCIPLEQRA
jgi:hypothetical protein